MVDSFANRISKQTQICNIHTVYFLRMMYIIKQAYFFRHIFSNFLDRIDLKLKHGTWSVTIVIRWESVQYFILYHLISANKQISASISFLENKPLRILSNIHDFFAFSSWSNALFHFVNTWKILIIIATHHSVNFADHVVGLYLY